MSHSELQKRIEDSEHINGIGNWEAIRLCSQLVAIRKREYMQKIADRKAAKCSDTPKT